MKILYYFIILMIIGCSNNTRKWYPTKTAIFNSSSFQVGDIIVKDKLITDPISWMGHSSVIVDNNIIGDFPKLGQSYYTVDLNSWLNEPERHVVVLRYEHFDEKFKKKFLENVEIYGKGKYEISFSKKTSDNFYCSKFVWFLFYKTAQDLGYNLDLDSDGGFIVFPYDFLNSPFLKEVYQN
ncbi:hypothetical protein H5J22_10975 [Cetobacterium sp. 8H]|uniref:YiiX/YebB-like N1pC/P60 family cysteine hydrolase n=1 Tax=Cetobacterium sp. 8H TaxID=2759681 RepID=UPI00163C32A0|nr:YiiX/YebB-like N1pC/P60 family cysteine hydrolase [Cetobacterium sp. 8H]MBC2851919.1 hypothetical protein [Cetobacterium sp. 8H]